MSTDLDFGKFFTQWERPARRMVAGVIDDYQGFVDKIHDFIYMGDDEE